ncbi:MAG: amino acid permease, partial [Pseudomonadota bacterium]
LPLPMLVDSEAPLADLFARATGGSSAIIGGIGLIAVLNGALIQVIMAARVFYGLSSMGWLPAAVGRVNPRTRTPLIATAIVTATILAFALFLPLVTLAELTSLITLIIFAAVNLALWRVKRRDPAPANAWLVPGWLPVLGFLISASFAGFQVVDFLRRL